MGKVLIKLWGGLGNQMFQYAFYKECLARGMDAGFWDMTNGKKIWELKSKGTPEVFKVFKKVRIPEQKTTETVAFLLPYILMKLYKKIFHVSKLKFEEKASSCFDEKIYANHYGILEGYWQSEQYFKNAEQEIRESFTFEVRDAGLKEQIQEIEKTESISIHIRRGDYFGDEKCIRLYGGICTNQYYHRAIAYIQERVKNAKFYIFTDDPVWAKEQYSGDSFVFVDRNKFEHYENWYDMCLMSKCKHNIIANSSFSWWGAWLNENKGKIVIAPWKWLNNASTPDIYCKGWIKMKGK